ncbi:MAG: hypothetical protein WB581_05670 [Halobacteriota archaeon]
MIVAEPADRGTLTQLQAYIDVNAILAEAPFRYNAAVGPELINTPDDIKSSEE